MSVFPGTGVRASGRVNAPGRDATIIPFPVRPPARPPVRRGRPAPIRLTRRGRVVVVVAVVLLMVAVAAASMAMAGR